MTVYVDSIQKWPTRIRCFHEGSYHMITDNVEELHVFAKRIGLRREWFQPLSWPHYDLAPTVRIKAVAFGAVEKTCRELAVIRFEWRHKLHKEIEEIIKLKLDMKEK